jgi:hypothetical protein
MGRKGVSKRKAKKSKSFSNDNNNVSSNTREGSSVQSLVKDNRAPLNKGNSYPAAGSNTKNKKG